MYQGFRTGIALCKNLWTKVVCDDYNVVVAYAMKKDAVFWPREKKKAHEQ